MIHHKMFFLFVLVVSMSFMNAQDIEPSFEDVLSLSSVSSPSISPDGKYVVFNRNSTDWTKNRYDRELWIAKEGKEAIQLTNNLEGNSGTVRWSPDSKWIGFLSKRSEETQIHVINVDGGEAIQVSHSDQGISHFRWSPDGSQIAFLQSEDKTKMDKSKEDLYGAYSIEDAEYSLTQLWLMDFSPLKFHKNITPSQAKDSTYKASLEPTLLLGDSTFTVTDFSWSPDGKKIVFDHQPTPAIISFIDADISIMDVATKEYKILVQNESSDGVFDWSPDGKSIVYGTNLDDKTSNFYKNDKIYRINIDGTNNTQLATSFDENLGNINWTPSGIYGTARQKTKVSIVRIDPDDGNVQLIRSNLERVYSLDFSDDGQEVVLTGNNDDGLTEVYTTDITFKQLDKRSSSTLQIDNWKVSDSEVVSWSSKDGATIEGVLHKPQDYNPNKKYPLMVVIHGGPTGTSVPSPVASYVYPIVQWLNKGALVLQPNYRGSAGYGEAFRSLNVNNLGVGDAWDVLSGVEYLEKLGIVDGDKVASMGWSQGGYISAFLTTNSDKFKAISVGAGISNWMTYYVSTDITPFTQQYLNATPWSNKEIYEKTSPMTNINNAQTPTLIQHGEFDRRVPTSNAYELYQGLLDVGVDTELIIYKGFGHGITKPKERLAAVWHNWKWFGKYIWNEEIEIPMK